MPVHPSHREVIPLAPEPIEKQDGSDKNDCERNAAKRLLRQIRQEHPHLKLIVVEDGLASNAPHIRELKALDMHFILGAKPGDHAFLFDKVIAAWEEDRVTTISWKEKETTCEISYINGVPLNEVSEDLLVNWLCYSEGDPKGGERKWTWVTDLEISRSNARKLMQGGRCRWKIENETFNTLKNQGYHFEHNYGHGTKHLSVVLAMLMMLAFLVDQVQQLCCPLFQATLKKMKTKRALWEIWLSLSLLYLSIDGAPLPGHAQRSRQEPAPAASAEHLLNGSLGLGHALSHSAPIIRPRSPCAFLHASRENTSAAIARR